MESKKRSEIIADSARELLDILSKKELLVHPHNYYGDGDDDINYLSKRKSTEMFIRLHLTCLIIDLQGPVV